MISLFSLFFPSCFFLSLSFFLSLRRLFSPTACILSLFLSLSRREREKEPFLLEPFSSRPLLHTPPRKKPHSLSKISLSLSQPPLHQHGRRRRRQEAAARRHDHGAARQAVPLPERRLPQPCLDPEQAGLREVRDFEVFCFSSSLITGEKKNKSEKREKNQKLTFSLKNTKNQKQAPQLPHRRRHAPRGPDPAQHVEQDRLDPQVLRGLPRRRLVSFWFFWFCVEFFFSGFFLAERFSCSSLSKS